MEINDHENAIEVQLRNDDVIEEDVVKSRRRHFSQRSAATTNDDSEIFTLGELEYEIMVVILSGLYGIMLVVLGLVLPVTEALCNARSTQAKRFEIFYLYLYGVSMLFLIYVYTYLLRKDGFSLASVSGRLTRSFSRTSSGKDTLDTASNHVSSSGRSRTKKIAFISHASKHTGSFYLRVGAVGFGVGSMIHSAIVFGHYLEMSHSNHPCSKVLQGLKPFAHMWFTFTQMYFVFMNSKMCIHKYKSLARFGLMHMCGTNVCVWLRTIVMETLHVMNDNKRKQYLGVLSEEELHQGTGGNQTTLMEEGPGESENTGHLPELKCHSDAVMGQLQESSSVYLFPCTIQYSLICAGVLFVMWSNVGEGEKPMNKSLFKFNPSSSLNDTSAHRTHHIRVDCAGSSQGLFLGVAVLVAALCCLIWFYVLIGDSDKHVVAGSLLGHLSEDFIYFITIIAIVIAALQMKNMQFSPGINAGIEEILTLVSLTGLGLFGMFSIVASIFYLDTMDGKLTVLTNTIMLIQAGSQATFILVTLEVSAIDGQQASNKPGRNCVTFLLVSNFTLWVMNTFETQSLEHNIVQVDFYGANAWSIFSHISVPLGIYFRFHSTVCLSNIWKHAWKTSKGAN